MTFQLPIEKSKGPWKKGKKLKIEQYFSPGDSIFIISGDYKGEIGKVSGYDNEKVKIDLRTNNGVKKITLDQSNLETYEN